MDSLKTMERVSEGTRSICFKEGEYTVKNISSEDELLQAFRLRHEVFCEELGWVPQTPDRLEMDDYDDYAVSFGIFDAESELVAYLRLIMPTDRFMMEREFRHMVSPDHVIRKEHDTAEISRLCISLDARRDQADTGFGKHTLSVVLLKGVYRWCELNGIRYLYAVTEDKVYRIARARGFTFELIGEPISMPEGINVVVIRLNWDEFENITYPKRPRLAEWFNQYISTPDQTLSLLHAPL